VLVVYNKIVAFFYEDLILEVVAVFKEFALLQNGSETCELTNRGACIADMKTSFKFVAGGNYFAEVKFF
jgi:hypothetical protein